MTSGSKAVLRLGSRSLSKKEKKKPPKIKNQCSMFPALKLIRRYIRNIARAALKLDLDHLLLNFKVLYKGEGRENAQQKKKKCESRQVL